MPPENEHFVPDDSSNIYWHKIVLTCPGCDQPIQILNFCFNRYGVVMLECICIRCSKDIEWKKMVTELVCRAFMADQLHDYNADVEGGENSEPTGTDG